MMRYSLCASILLLATAASAADDAKGPQLNAVKATFKYSSDEGKTYALDALPDLPSAGRVSVFGRAEITVDDPAKIGMLWLTTVRDSGGLCPVNDRAIGPKYVCNSPVLLNAKVQLNGKDVPPQLPDMLVLRWAIDPALLVKGPNVITFSGQGWNALVNCGSSEKVPLAFRLQSTAPDAPALRSGPALGPLGDEYFTLAARTWIPCEMKVTVTPTEPAGAAATHTGPREILHKLRIPLPKGTRKFTYAIEAGASKAGPWTVRVPDEKTLRFVVLGQTATGSGVAGLLKAKAALEKVDPDFIVHTGSLVLMSYWDFAWDDCLFAPWGDLLAHVPMVGVPAYRDLYSSAFLNFLYHPSADGNWAQWTWTAGPVRFIGLDGWSAAANAAATAKWVEDVLKDAKEPYVFDITSYPAYTTNAFGRGIAGHNYDKETVQPLLAKYKATASLGCTGKYEYIPAPNANAVDTLITGGVGAPMAPGWNKYNYVIFQIKDGKCSVQAVAYETGEVLDRRTFEPRK
ncbi:MAG: hypothetical protein ABFD92_12685 [Planctomycetaceae bacterium]|nr:hypothetical protein [Planctomycetaceae bacterium]